MSSILVTYRGAPAALVGIRQFSFLGDVRHLPPGHPAVRMVTHKAYYAQLVLAGKMPGDYTDEDAERFARLALIDPDELERRRHHSDAALASRFGVPTDAVVHAREEAGRGH
jgi:hypothetical protein